MLKEQIFNLVKEYYTKNHLNKKIFKPGQDVVRYAGRVFDEHDMIKLVESCLDFWLTEGRFCEEFAEKIIEFLGIENVILANSGSSANLLALASLTSPKLGDRRLKPGDEVIAVAAGFPSTVSPILQNRLTPVFVDVDLGTYNIDVDMLERAVSNKTKCIFLAHTLGNPFNVDAVLKLARERGLWLIEDNCDAFGSRYGSSYTGTFGHIATLSFYPAHHITTGEGGAVVTGDDELARIIRSFRDWGRDCYCAGGENNTCGKRFSQSFGSLPRGYDHKYVYSEVGYNLKMTEMQAAIGSAQMDKLPRFCQRRKENFSALHNIFKKYENFFILPEATKKSDPAWFAYMATVRDTAPFTRTDAVNYLNEHKIETRNFFAGNIIRQPAYIDTAYRVADHLNNTDLIMNNAFFLGTFPGLTREMIDYIETTIDAFVRIW